MSENKLKPIKVVAITRGYLKNKIIEDGTIFMFDGPYSTKDGKQILPSWMRLVKGKAETAEDVEKAKAILQGNVSALPGREKPVEVQIVSAEEEDDSEAECTLDLDSLV